MCLTHEFHWASNPPAFGAISQLELYGLSESETSFLFLQLVSCQKQSYGQMDFSKQITKFASISIPFDYVFYPYCSVFRYRFESKEAVFFSSRHLPSLPRFNCWTQSLFTQSRSTVLIPRLISFCVNWQLKLEAGAWSLSWCWVDGLSVQIKLERYRTSVQHIWTFLLI